MEQGKQEAFRRAVEDEPFAVKMGMRLISVDEGRAVVEMKIRHDSLNTLGMIHGGAVFSLIDEAFEIASNSHGTKAVALNMNVTFHRPPALGDLVRAEAKEIHRTRKTATYEIKVTDPAGALIASCTALVYRKGERLDFLDGE
ncbi:MAG: PaaI family thioesterase [Deltaproteobacteria bacterium]|nr:PaaI family thioesterase [Deltaproteobacteria bacterium]MBW2017817.1 PaaI family thioesterase [Deltaproteobacteria bacterium]MBW2128475.1 PaaI family thioesterase [Deltaproteobacteria bacterium]MBW2303666.1 PaaI family thioesterase [Deltaproteobacteria bacterium]